MDWQQLLHDRRFQLGAAGAAALGGFVWYRRRKTGSTAGTSDAATSAAGSAQAGTLDTSGTDIANWLGQYSGSLQNQLDAYAQSLTDAESNLGKIPAGATSGGPPKPGTGGTVGDPSPHPQPRPPVWNGPIKMPTVPGPTVVTVVPFTKANPAWNSTLSGIAGRYHTTVAALVKLNPAITNPNLIRVGQRIRVS